MEPALEAPKWTIETIESSTTKACILWINSCMTKLIIKVSLLIAF
jgi:hypothetical protein